MTENPYTDEELEYIIKDITTAISNFEEDLIDLRRDLNYYTQVQKAFKEHADERT